MIAVATPHWRRSGRAAPARDSLRYVACWARYANFAVYAMYAHRLWINLWISLGHPADNPSQPGGNAPVTQQWQTATHNLAVPHTHAGHSACARPQQPSPGRTAVIPSIHRPYDDYQSSYGSQINIQVGPSTRRRSSELEKEGDR